MSLYIALVCLGTGVSIPIWWFRHGVEPSEGAWFHVAAELATAFVLIAAGALVLVDELSKVAVLLSAFGLGMLAYSLIGSPGPAFARHDKRLLVLFAFSWVVALPAMVMRFVR